MKRASNGFHDVVSLGSLVRLFKLHDKAIDPLEWRLVNLHDARGEWLKCCSICYAIGKGSKSAGRTNKIVSTHTVEYLAAFLAFAAACLGIFGETRNPKGHGWRRLTIFGYTALIVAVVALGASVNQVRNAQVEAEWRHYEAAHRLADAANDAACRARSSRTSFGRSFSLRCDSR